MKHQRLFIAGLFLAVSVLSGVIIAGFTMRSSGSSVYAADTSAVELLQKSVSPNSITLKVGQKVRITNSSGEVRELSLGSGHTDHSEMKNHHDHDGRFSTGRIGTDEAWEGSFSEAGTYFLHDHEQPHVNLLIVVY